MRNLTAGIFFFLALALTSCRDGKPEDVVLKFYYAVDNVDFETAKSYVVKDAFPMFDVLADMVGEQQPESEQEDGFAVVIKSTEVNEDKTAVTVIVQLMARQDSTVVDELSILLQKEDSEWKIVF